MALSSLSSSSAEELYAPAKPWLVLLTLVAAMLLNLLPLPGYALAARPDFLALVVLYWCIQEPRFVGIGVAWSMGLLMDVADATLFGQHALAYSVLAFGAEYFRRRVLRFPLWQQAAHVALLLLVCQLLVLGVRLVSEATPVGWVYFMPILTGAISWPVLSVLLRWRERIPIAR